MSELPIAPIDRLIRKAGIDRVSEDASKALRDVLENLAIEIAKEANEWSRHAGRKTVVEEDIKQASKKITRMTSTA